VRTIIDRGDRFAVPGMIRFVDHTGTTIGGVWLGW
jgi:hypothetical protein